jgi:Zn ribbon nucleic-acid-binding protein
MSSLKDCPKCQSDSVFEGGDDQWSQVECLDCGYSLKRKNYDKCIEAWNKLKRNENEEI